MNDQSGLSCLVRDQNAGSIQIILYLGRVDQGKIQADQISQTCPIPADDHIPRNPMTAFG